MVVVEATDVVVGLGVVVVVVDVVVIVVEGVLGVVLGVVAVVVLTVVVVVVVGSAMLVNIPHILYNKSYTHTLQRKRKQAMPPFFPAAHKTFPPAFTLELCPDYCHRLEYLMLRRCFTHSI